MSQLSSKLKVCFIKQRFERNLVLHIMNYSAEVALLAQSNDNRFLLIKIYEQQKVTYLTVLNPQSGLLATKHVVKEYFSILKQEYG